MAEIDVQRRNNMSWLWWLLGLIVVALIVWVLLDGTMGETAMEPEAEMPAAEVPATGVAPTPADPSAPTVPIADINSYPRNWFGRTVAGEVEVVEVPTNRGFWVESDGERLFALVVDEPEERPINIMAGQTLRIEDAELRDPSDLDDLPGEPIDTNTRQILGNQQVFLLLDEDDIEVVDRY